MKKIYLVLFALLLFKNTKAQKLSAGLETVLSIPVAQRNMLACDTIFSFPTLENWTSGLAFDGTSFWACSYNTTWLYKYSMAGVKSDSVDIPSTTTYPGGDLDFDGSNILFSREDNATLYKIDPVTKAITGQFNLPQFGSGDPNGFGVAWDGTYIWHTTYSPTSLLYKLDATTGAILSAVTLNQSTVLPIKFIGGQLYGIGLGGPNIFEIDTATGICTNIMPWCLTYPLGFTLANANGHLYGLASQPVDHIYQFDTLLFATSIFSQQQNTFDFSFQNPAAADFKISFKNNSSENKITIADVQGRIVFETEINPLSSEISIPANQFSKGIYLILVRNEKQFAVKKMLKL